MASLPDMAPTFLREMVADISVIFFEKGIGPFKKPLLFALPAILIIYSAVYSPLGSKVTRVSAELAKLELISQNYQDYRNAREKVMSYQARLPKAKDKDDWLNYTISATAKKNKIVVDRLGAQEETEIAGFLVVSRQVTVTTSYSKVGAWLADIENSPILLKVTMLTIRKLEGSPGSIEAAFKLSTVFPRSPGPVAAGGGL